MDENYINYMSDEEPSSGDYPLEYSLEKDILMHRDAHFAGDFASMLSYYQTGGRGAVLEVSIEQIQALHNLENEISSNLAAQVLGGAEAEKVAKSKAAYQRLREVYESDLAQDDPARLIADLILVEDDEETCLEAIIAKGACMQEPLLNLLASQEFADDLCPGYGLAPLLAAKALGEIGDQKALEALFVLLDDEREELVFEVLEALKTMGPIASSFAQKTLVSQPMSRDNHRAAYLLSSVFSHEEQSAKAALSFLQQNKSVIEPGLLSILILLCASLKSEDQRLQFQNWAEQEDLSPYLKKDLEAVYYDWKTNSY